MSLERACVNCERCFGLVSSFVVIVQENVVKLAYSNDQIYQARNEAMKALEEFAKLGDYSSLATKALEACRKCDYSSPRIADITKDKPIIKEKE